MKFRRYIKLLFNNLNVKIYQSRLTKWIIYYCDTSCTMDNKFNQYFVKALSLILTSGLCLSIFYTTVVTIFYILPRSNFQPHEKTLLIIVFTLIVINIVYNYASALLAGPGHPPKIDTAHSIGEPLSRNKCEKCKSIKPQRSHHCSICKQCILKMDHHCLWLNGCIGEYNYRYFFLFIFWTLIGSIFVIYFSYNYLSIIFSKCMKQKVEKPGLCLAKNYFINVIGCIVIGIFGAFFTLLLNIPHAYFISKNMTSLEYQIGPKIIQKEKNISDEDFKDMKGKLTYSLGLRKNWTSVLGSTPFPISFFSMISRKPPRAAIFKDSQLDSVTINNRLD